MLVLLALLTLGLAVLQTLVTRLGDASSAQSHERLAQGVANIWRLDAAMDAVQQHARAFVRTGDGESLSAFNLALREARQRLATLAQARCDLDGATILGPIPLQGTQALLNSFEAAVRLNAAPLDPREELPRDNWLDAERTLLICERQRAVAEADRIENIRAGIQAVLVCVGVVLLAMLLVYRYRRLQLEEQVRFSEKLIDAIPMPLTFRMPAPEGSFLLVNRAWEKRHGLKREEVIGDKPGHHFSQAAVEELSRLDTQAVRTGEPVEFEYAPGRAERRNLLVRLQAVHGEKGELKGIVFVENDLTSLRRKEAELIELNTRLKQLSVQMIEAQEEERRRISRDLHDQVGQILTALKLQLGSLAKVAAIAQPAQSMAAPISLAEEALKHTRDLTASLHPHLLDDLGLEPALGWLIDRFIRPSIAHVDLRCRIVPPRGPESVELVAFRVVQEALTNVVRHAQATRVGVMLETTGDGSLSIEVIDDGVGFESGETWFDLNRATSVGVSSMTGRVQEVGGEVRIESKPGTGTSLRVRLPW